MARDGRNAKRLQRRLAREYKPLTAIEIGAAAGSAEMEDDGLDLSFGVSGAVGDHRSARDGRRTARGFGGAVIVAGSRAVEVERRRVVDAVDSDRGNAGG